MREETVFKRYDIRGKYPEELDEEFAKRIGKAIGRFTSENYSSEVVVTKDTKQSSESLRKALITGINSTGCKVLDAGTGPTDYTAFTGKEHEAVSVQVTSSHLPLEFNGFKLMYPKGNGFTNPDLDQIKQLFREENFESGNGKTVELEDAIKAYKNRLKEVLENFDADFNKKIVVDTLGGATYTLLVELLQDLGAEVIDLAEDKEKMPYRDPPNPKPAMLEELKHAVNENNADLGIATDMDGDRVKIYRNGFISGDMLFGVFAQLFDSDLVASVDTSKIVEEILEPNRRIDYTRVGDPFVMKKAIEQDVKLAGEPNGHYAFLDFVPYSSGILSALIAAGVDIDNYLSKLPDYHIEKKNIQVEDKEMKMEAVKEHVKANFELISEIDGVKFKDKESTVLIRSSGSSPKLRVIVESEKSTSAEETAWKVEKIIRNA